MYKNIFILFYIAVSSSLIYSQDVSPKDSINLLIKNEKTDSIRFRHIYNAIAHIGQLTQTEVLDFHSQGLTLCKQIEDKNILLSHYNNTAMNLYYRGHIEPALNMFKTLENLSRKYNNLNFIVKAKFGLVEYEYDNGNKNGALNILHSLEKELKNQDASELKSILYNKLASIYRDIGEHRKAINYLNASNNLYPQNTINRKVFSNYTTLGRIYRFMGDNDSARINYKIAQSLAISMEDEQALATVLNNLGNIEHISGNYEDAIENYMRSLKVKEKYGNARGTAIAYHNIGAIKYDMKSYYEAIKDFEKSDELGNKINFKSINIYNKQKIGNCYRELSDIDKALEFHKDALAQAINIDFTNGILEAHQNIGTDQLMLNNFDDANVHLLRGLKLAREVGSKPFESSILVLIAKSYLKDERTNHSNQSKLNDDSSLNDHNVESYLLRAKELADEMNNVDSKKLALEGLNLLYSKTNRNRDNVAILKEQLSLKDSLFFKERTQAIADWETKYATAEKEKEIIQLEIEQKESKARVKFWSVISLLLLLIISVGTYLFLQLKQAREKLQLQNDALNELNQTKDKFFGIIAHDIRNPIIALESVDEQIDYYLKKNEIDKLTNIGGLVGKTARHLHSLLDNLLNWALLQTRSIPFNPEKIRPSEIVNDIIDMVQANLLLKNQTVKSYIAPDLMIVADLASFSTIFRNLISNAIKYSQEGQVVEIRSYLKDKATFFTIKDNGVGIEKKVLNKLFTLEKRSLKGTKGEKGTGLGLVLCKEMVELHQGSIKIESEVGIGTTVTIEFPQKIQI